MNAIGYLLLIITAIVALQAILRSGRFAICAWPGMVFMYRARYSILVILSPLLLALAASSPNTILYTLLVLRDEPCGESSGWCIGWLGLSGNTFYFDLISVTMLSLLTVCLGLAQFRIIELYGEERLGNPTNLLLTLSPRTQVPSVLLVPPASRTWPWWKYAILLVCGLSLPCFVACASVHQQDIPLNPVARWPGECFSALLAILYGTIAATLFVFVMIMIELIVPGPEMELCGLLPFEDLLARYLTFWPFRVLIAPIPAASPWDQSPQLLLLVSRWLRGPGYTRRTGVVNPSVIFNAGHVQLALVALVALLFYASWSSIAYFDADWKNYRWPTLWYVQLLIFFIGVMLNGFAFWLDRFGVPPTVITVGWVSLMYLIGGTDNYYQLGPTLTKTERNNAIKALKKEETRQTKHVFVTAVRDRLQLEEKKAAEARAAVKVSAPAAAGRQPMKQSEPDFVLRHTLWSTLCRKPWDEFVAGGSDRKEDAQPYKTLVIVTAAGGGIQASAWTAQVLTGLDEEFEGFTGSIGMISGVSGGSVGTMFYLGHRGPRAPTMSIDPADSKKINNSARTSLMEAVGWGTAFPDLARNIVPGLAPEFIDRGWALESACWNQMGPQPTDRVLMQDLRMLDLTQAFERGKMPAVVFNATAVETGQRVMFSSADIDTAVGNTSLVNTPLEWFHFYRDYYKEEKVPNRAETVKYYRSVAPEKVNPRVSTAVRLSASFSWAAPVARPARDEIIKDGTEDYASQARIHLCDGGYASNSGLTTVITALESLMEQLADPAAGLPQPAFDRILVVRIEPFPPTLAQYSKNNNGLVAQFAGPLAAMANARISSQAERDDIDAQLLSCIGRDVLLRLRRTWMDKIEISPLEQQAEMLLFAMEHERDIEQLLPKVDLITIQFENDQAKDSPPLSWKLIPTAEKAITKRWNGIASGTVASANRVTGSKALTYQDFTRFFKRREKKR